MACYEQGLASALRIGDRWHVGAMLADVATIQVHLGRLGDAFANAERAVA